MLKIGASVKVIFGHSFSSLKYAGRIGKIISIEYGYCNLQFPDGVITSDGFWLNEIELIKPKPNWL